MKVRNDADVLAAFHGGSYATVIPVSCDIETKTSRAVMGTGLGKRASTMWPEVPIMLGKFLSVGGAHTYVLPIMRQPNAWTVCAPIKYTMNQKPDADLIGNMAWQLRYLADMYRWERVFLPRLGCGGPRDLDWASEVRPLFKEAFDDRFVIVHMDEPAPVVPTVFAPPVKVGAVPKTMLKKRKAAGK